MRSPDGNELRQWAAAQEQVAQEVRAYAKRFGPVGEDASRAVSGFPFSGPFEQAVRSRVSEIRTVVEVIVAQLESAASQIQAEAAASMAKAVAADAIYAMHQLFDGKD